MEAEHSKPKKLIMGETFQQKLMQRMQKNPAVAPNNAQYNVFIPFSQSQRRN